ncbi:polyadenylate-binding protein 4-like [Diaphorina citri]|uniref:Polyadenylate-binding protein 4-like n=1 Tax=Diaphorina citri TaxID=121845 RepID=A0A1S4E863_DIACI|nr:polyadenylate-binding protein 4-like [Diaphorina citri]
MASNGKELQTEEKELASEPLASWDEGISDDEGARSNKENNKVYKENELHVNNLEPSVDNQALINEFKKFGTLRDVRVARNKNDESRGFAIIVFNTPAEAKKARVEMNGHLIGSKPVIITFVELKPGQRSKPVGPEEKQYKKDKVFVKNLVETVDEEELKSHFIKFGNIIEVKIVRDENGKSKGFGFIQFFSYKAAEKAIIEMNGRMIQHNSTFVSLAEIVPGKKVFPKVKPPLLQPARKNKIFVANLPSNINNSEFEELFARFGTITSSSLVSDKHIGFIEFIMPKHATHAVSTMNGHVFKSKPLKVTLSGTKPGVSITNPTKAPKKPAYIDEVKNVIGIKVQY